MPPAPQIRTVGALRERGWTSRSVRDELRANLIARLRGGDRLFPGLLGYDDTVVRSLVNALLARHDILLLGLRGQGKTRLLRAIPTLLDEWMPALEGTDLREDPFAPASPAGRRILAEAGDQAPIRWLHREERYREKLATPDTSMADLIGDIDPVKAVSRGLGFGHEDAVQWGMIPRSNRGVFAVNELPDLQPRIQVGLLNLLEERDLQVRGVPLRLELDVLFVFSANPEDYTRRGNLITPLKDRIGSQIRTHYPPDLATSSAITDQEARGGEGETGIRVPAPLREALERVAFEARAATDLVDPLSGVSQRVPIAALELLRGAVEARCARQETAVGEARLADLFSILPAVAGKLELTAGERDEPEDVARLLLSRACRAACDGVFRAPTDRPRGGDDLDRPVTGWFESGNEIVLSSDSTEEERAAELSSLEGLEPVMRSLARDPSWDPGQDLSAWKEVFLEGLCCRGRISREVLDGSVRFGDRIREAGR